MCARVRRLRFLFGETGNRLPDAMVTKIDYTSCLELLIYMLR